MIWALCSSTIAATAALVLMFATNVPWWAQLFALFVFVDGLAGFLDYLRTRKRDR